MAQNDQYAILNSINDAVLIIDQEYTIVFANQHFSELFNESAEKIIGGKCYQILHHSPFPCVEKNIPDNQCVHAQVFAKGIPVSVTHHHIMPDGQKRFLQISASPIKGENGAIVRMISIIKDITAEEDLQETLDAALLEHEAILNNAPFSVSYQDRELRIIKLNPVMEQLIGLKSDEVKGRYCYDVWGQYADDDSKQGKEKMCDACKSHNSMSDGLNYTYERKVGDRYIEVTSCPVKNKTDDTIGVLECGLDITERKRAEKNLINSERRFRDLFKNIGTGVAIYESVENGNDFIFKNLNPAALKNSKLKKKNIINKSVKDVFPEVVELGLFDVFQRVWQTGIAEHHPSSIYRDERIELWVENYVYKLPSNEIVAVYDDITSRKEAERKQLYLQRRLETLWKIAKMLDADLKSICNTILEEIIDMTESQYGFFGFLDDEEKIMTLASWSNDVMVDCKVSDKPIKFSIQQSGIWGNAVRTRKPFILNDYQQQNCLNKKGTPQGHIPLTRLMSIPVLMADKIVAVAAVANKKKAYSEDDKNQLAAFLTNAQIVIDRKQNELKIIQAKEEWQKSFDAITDIVTIQDKEMHIVRANRAAHDFFNVDYGYLVGKHCYEIFRGIAEPCHGCPMIASLHDRNIHSEIIQHQNLGKLFHVSSAPVTDKNGDIQYLVHTAKDITEQKRLEEELFQAHKMEAIGTLAGGIAHDFNNILSAIIGFTQLAQVEVEDSSQAASDLAQVLLASKRATGLVKQILTFSRKGTHKRASLQPYLIVKEALKLMRASLPATIEIQEDIDTESGAILADPTKIHQIIVNLCTNALHAMEEESGTLKITLNRRILNTENLQGHQGVKPGPFIELAVSDSGCGMDLQTQQRIFEPYFTTKETGKGTGLGLAVVLGVVKDYGGMITVDSAPGIGTTVHVYFPAVTEDVEEPAKAEKENDLPTGTERILTVDDESAIVTLQKTLLSRLGYTVTTETSSEDAFATFKSDPHRFDLLITDQTMPVLTGASLAKEVMNIRPDMPVILCTGYSTTLSEEKALEIGIKKYLFKPVSSKKLATTIRNVLDGN